MKDRVNAAWAQTRRAGVVLLAGCGLIKTHMHAVDALAAATR